MSSVTLKPTLESIVEFVNASGHGDLLSVKSEHQLERFVEISLERGRVFIAPDTFYYFGDTLSGGVYDSKGLLSGGVYASQCHLFVVTKTLFATEYEVAAVSPVDNKALELARNRSRGNTYYFLLKSYHSEREVKDMLQMGVKYKPEVDSGDLDELRSTEDEIVKEYRDKLYS